MLKGIHDSSECRDIDPSLPALDIIVTWSISSRHMFSVKLTVLDQICKFHK